MYVDQDNYMYICNYKYVDIYNTVLYEQTLKLITCGISHLQCYSNRTITF